MFTIQDQIDGSLSTLGLFDTRTLLGQAVGALFDPNDDDAGIEESMVIVSVVLATQPLGSLFIAPPLDGSRKRQLERAYSFIEQARDALNEGDESDELLNGLVEQVDAIQDKLNDEIGD